jgi:hypothetical protein
LRRLPAARESNSDAGTTPLRPADPYHRWSTRAHPQVASGAMITVSAPPAFVTVLPMQVRLLLRQRTPPRRCLRRSPPPATPLQNAFVCWFTSPRGRDNSALSRRGFAGPLLDLNSRRLPGLGTLHRFLGRRWRPAGGERQGSQRDEAPSKRRTSRIFCTSRVSIPRSAARAPGMVAQPTTTR